MPQHQAELLGALRRFAEVALHLPDIKAVKIGRSCATLSSTDGFNFAVLMWWTGPSSRVHFEELHAANGETRLGGRSFREEHPQNWQELRFILWLLTDDTDYVQEPAGGGRTAEADPAPPGDDSRLSTIPEEASQQTADSLFLHDEPHMQAFAAQAGIACQACAADGTPQDLEEVDEARVPPEQDDLVEFVARTITTEWYEPSLEPLAPQEVLELWYTADTAKLAYRKGQGGPTANLPFPEAGEFLRVQVYASTSRAQTVVQRDDALLKPEEVKKELAAGHAVHPS